MFYVPLKNNSFPTLYSDEYFQILVAFYERIQSKIAFYTPYNIFSINSRLNRRYDIVFDRLHVRKRNLLYNIT